MEPGTYQNLVMMNGFELVQQILDDAEVYVS